MKNIIIIGNGCAGYNAAKAIREKDKNSNIVIISNENLLTYYRPLLSDYLNEDKIDSKFYLSKDEWYKENSIELKLGINIDKIDTKEKKVYFNNNFIAYDELIIATGSNNIFPSIPGHDKKGVFTLKDMEDLNNIKSWMKTCKKVIVVGGGILGLEAAWELKLAGFSVSVIEAASHIMNKQLDSEASDILRNSLEDKGVEIYTNTMLEEIKGLEKVSSIKLSKNIVLDADMVIFSVGIKPNIPVITGSSIEINRGILVNKNMETNIENVYACGDVCELEGRVYGNWPASILMGKVAGANSIGENLAFKGYKDSINFVGADLKVFSIGFIPNKDSISMQYLDKENKIYKKVFFQDNILIGAILIGDIKPAMKLMKSLNKLSLEEFIQEYKEFIS